MKIFVSICSYRDPLLVYTLKSLIQSKSSLAEVVYGIFEQTEKENSLETLHPELISRPDVKYKRIDPQYSEGVGWARNINALQLTDEDFYYQIDSHMVFDNNWDRQLINDYKEGCLIANSNKVVISSNCKNFNLVEGHVKLEHNKNVACIAKFYQFDKSLSLFAHGEHTNPTTSVMPASHIFAGNMFTHADWINNVGINPKIFFHGEEQIMVLSSFMVGYSIFHGKQINCYHYIGSNQHTSKQDYNPIVSDEVIQERKYRSDLEFRRFIDSVDDVVFEEFRRYSGVDYINRKIEKSALTNAIKPNIEVDWVIPDKTD
jgi:hypothetical protein